jgi:hypothetical protein
LSSVTIILDHYGLWSLKQDEVIITICGWEQAFKWCDLHFAADKRMIDHDYEENGNEDDDCDDDGHQTA